MVKPAARCEFQNGISCEQGSCFDNYQIENKSSKDKVCDPMKDRVACECNKGVAEKNCFKHESSKRCKSCYAGFFLGGMNGDRVCYHNRCTCENGTGEVGTECELHRSEKCIRCNRGFELVNSKCTLIDGFEINKPYNTTDDQIACQCKDGVAEEICFKHESSKRCKSCNDGFFLGGMNGDRVCYHNRCTCENGTGEVGAECEVHRSEKCIRCNRGFELVNSKCKSIDGFEINKPYNITDDQIACKCNDGVAEEICFKHKSSKICRSCNAGFFLGGMNGDRVCYNNRCICENGVGFNYKSKQQSIYKRSNEICEINKTEKCAYCKINFSLINFKCIPVF